MKGKIKTLFWLYKSKVNLKGLAPIYLRLSKNRERIEISTGLTILPKQWDSKRGRVRGQSESVKELNNVIDGITAKIYKISNQSFGAEGEISLDEIKRQLAPTDEKSFLEYFDLHIERMKTLSGRDFSEGSLSLYEKTRSNFQEYLGRVHRRSDISIFGLNYSIVEGFSDYLKTNEKNVTNTVIKKLQRLNHIVNILVRKGLINRNPFLEFKLKKESREIIYLTSEELQRIETKSFPIKRLQIIKDIFIFSCYTSLAYKEVMNLKNENIKFDDQGRAWIIIKRQKTDKYLEIPILPKAKCILNKYLGLSTNHIFTRISNQKLNAYLKEIGDVCGITKNLTFHVARKTFATTVTLTKGVSLDSVSKLLGHSSVTVTSNHYAVVNNEKILNEMKDLLKD